jgi:SAM-dependent methyltransferase
MVPIAPSLLMLASAFLAGVRFRPSGARRGRRRADAVDAWVRDMSFSLSARAARLPEPLIASSAVRTSRKQHPSSFRQGSRGGEDGAIWQMREYDGAELLRRAGRLIRRSVMGASVKTLRRLLDLKRAGYIGEGSRMMELGSQNLNCELGGEYLSSFVKEFRGTAAKLDIVELDRVAAGGTMASLMKLCGLEYVAADIFDAENTLLFDLNTDEVPNDLRGSFDLVTNFGTTEHVFDQYRCFRTIHEFTKPGALMYHDLPMGGYFYHGFFSYTPLLFNHIAIANHYEILFRHFSKVPADAPPQHQASAELREHGWPDAGFHDVGIEFILKRTDAAGFRLPVEVQTSLAVDRAFLERKRSDIVIVANV